MSQQNGNELAERFALEYVKDLNATQAYLRARSGAEIKATTAATEGWKLLRKPAVAARVQQLKLESAGRLQIQADAVLRELAICAYSDVRDYIMDGEGRLALAPDAHPLASRAVSSVKRKTTTRGTGENTTTEHTTELKLWDKPGTLKTLAQHLKLIGSDEDVPPGGAVLRVVFVRE